MDFDTMEIRRSTTEDLTQHIQLIPKDNVDDDDNNDNDDNVGDNS